MGLFGYGPNVKAVGQVQPQSQSLTVTKSCELCHAVGCVMLIDMGPLPMTIGPLLVNMVHLGYTPKPSGSRSGAATTAVHQATVTQSCELCHAVGCVMLIDMGPLLVNIGPLLVDMIHLGCRPSFQAVGQVQPQPQRINRSSLSHAAQCHTCSSWEAICMLQLSSDLVVSWTRTWSPQP